MNQTYTGNLWDLAESSSCQTFANFPRENSWVFPLALDYGGDDTRGEEPRSAPSYGLGLEESGAAVTAQDLTDAPVGNLEECAVVWRTNVFVAHVGHFFHQKKVRTKNVISTRSILDIWLGRTPSEASSIIFLLFDSGRGLPLRNMPPNWLTRPPPYQNTVPVI